MALFAETFILKLDLPFSEYWLPLLIGMGVGVCALRRRLVFGKQRAGNSSKATADVRPGSIYPRQCQRAAPVIPKARQSHGSLHRVSRCQGQGRARGSWTAPWAVCACNRPRNTRPGVKMAVLPVNAPEMTPWVDIEVRTAVSSTTATNSAANSSKPRTGLSCSCSARNKIADLRLSILDLRM